MDKEFWGDGELIAPGVKTVSTNEMNEMKPNYGTIVFNKDLGKCCIFTDKGWITT